MASETVSDAIELETNLARTVAYLELAKWIEGARRVLDDLQNTAIYADTLKHELGTHGILYNHSWTEGASDGLVYRAGRANLNTA